MPYPKKTQAEKSATSAARQQRYRDRRKQQDAREALAAQAGAQEHSAGAGADNLPGEDSMINVPEGLGDDARAEDAAANIHNSCGQNEGNNGAADTLADQLAEIRLLCNDFRGQAPPLSFL